MDGFTVISNNKLIEAKELVSIIKGHDQTESIFNDLSSDNKILREIAKEKLYNLIERL